MISSSSPVYRAGKFDDSFRRSCHVFICSRCPPFDLGITPDPKLLEHAKELLKKAPLIDTHNVWLQCCIGFKVPVVFAESANVPNNAYVAKRVRKGEVRAEPKLSLRLPS